MDLWAQVLRERVAAGRKLVEAISTALPVMPQPAETPVGHRARRARSEYGSHRKSGSVEKDAGGPAQPGWTCWWHLCIDSVLKLKQNSFACSSGSSW